MEESTFRGIGGRMLVLEEYLHLSVGRVHPKASRTINKCSRSRSLVMHEDLSSRALQVPQEISQHTISVKSSYKHSCNCTSPFSLVATASIESGFICA